MSSVITSGPRNDNYYMKIVVTGDLGVGKTFLVLKYIDDNVPTRQNSIPNSVRQSQWTKHLLCRGKPTKIHIWDTAGFNSISQHKIDYTMRQLQLVKEENWKPTVTTDPREATGSFLRYRSFFGISKKFPSYKL